ncbi:MAG: cell division protein SepF [Lachnospiraceae bacterium]|nr:cell division protein SepF [Lachnospiraceae bacterium]
MANFAEKLMSALNMDGGADYEEDIYEDDFDDSYDDDDDYDDSFLDEEEEEERAPKKKSPLSFRRSAKTNRRYSSSREEEPEEETSYSSRRRTSITKTKNQETGKVVKLLNTSSGNSFELQTQKPMNTNDSAKICDSIKQGKPVVVNLEALEGFEAQRIIDIVSGCVYAVDGNICTVSKYIYIFTPGNIDITGDLINSSDFSEDFPTVENEVY